MDSLRKKSYDSKKIRDLRHDIDLIKKTESEVEEERNKQMLEDTRTDVMGRLKLEGTQDLINRMKQESLNFERPINKHQIDEKIFLRKEKDELGLHKFNNQQVNNLKTSQQNQKNEDDIFLNNSRKEQLLRHVKRDIQLKEFVILQEIKVIKKLLEDETNITAKEIENNLTNYNLTMQEYKKSKTENEELNHLKTLKELIISLEKYPSSKSLSQSLRNSIQKIISDNIKLIQILENNISQRREITNSEL